MTFTLVQSMHVLSEEHTEVYKRYIDGVPQLKHVLDAKNNLPRWAMPNLERRGV